MKILFLHGWQSTPGGVKPTYLKDHGHDVLNPALPDDDFDAAVRIAQAEFDQHRPDVVVGSSRGGAVAMNLKIDAPLVLLCPAWKRFGTARTVKPGTIILHSKADDVVPFSDSVELVRNSGLPSDSLVEVGTEHRLADPDSLAKMLKACEEMSAPNNPAIFRKAGSRFRFGIGTLLVITTMYAMLFGILRALGATPWVFVMFALLFTAVGLGQRLLFKGQRPQKASIVAGACFFVVLYVFSLVVFGAEYTYHPFVPFDPVEGAFFGAIYGYVAGLLISGAFWITGELRNVLGRTRDRKRTN